MIDRFLPEYDAREYHEAVVEAEPDRTYAALWQADFGRSRIVRFLFAVRGLPWRARLGLDDLTRIGFVILGEEPGREIVFGLTGRFWRVAGDLHPVGPEDFLSYSAPGVARAAWSFTVERAPQGGTNLSTETRVSTNDPVTRRAFRRYWRLIGPFSALIRRRILRVIQETAENVPQ